MGDITLDNKPSLLLQVPDDLAVCLLDIDTLVLWDLGCESTSLINGTRGNLVLGDDLVGETDSVIVLSPCWGLVDNTGTGFLGDVVVRQDSECSVLVLMVSSTSIRKEEAACLFGEVIKHWDISPSNHILSLETSDFLEFRLFLGIWLLSSGVLLVDCTEQFLEENEVLSFLEIVDLDVGEVGVDTECQVGSEGVWCGCPGKEGGGWVINQGEGDSD